MRTYCFCLEERWIIVEVHDTQSRDSHSIVVLSGAVFFLLENGREKKGERELRMGGRLTRVLCSRIGSTY